MGKNKRIGYTQNVIPVQAALQHTNQPVLEGAVLAMNCTVIYYT